MFEYYDNDFAHGRLVDTIITYLNRAIFISEVSGDQDLHYLDLESWERGVVNIRDKGVCVKPPRVGYYFSGDGWNYIERVPQRRWKQGLPADLFGGELSKQEGQRIGRVLNGKFRSFNYAKDRAEPTAFSPHFAAGGGCLYYKGKIVGAVSVEGHITLMENFLFLKEYLEESLK